jgi:hypothetical protein
MQFEFPQKTQKYGPYGEISVKVNNINKLTERISLVADWE